MEDQERKGFLGGRGEQNPCVVPPPGSDHTKVKVVQSHRIRCLGTCQTPHALVRKSVTVRHLVRLPSKDKEGKGESLAWSSKQAWSPGPVPVVTLKNVTTLPLSSSL